MITIDRVTITQIIGCLMQNPDLLSETDKYRLEMEDFRRLSDKYIFSAIYNLYINGAGNIHTIDIMNSLKDNSSAYDLIEKENGIAFLQDSESNANLANFNYYYNKLKKINLVIDLQKAGHDTSSIYCEDLLDKDRIKINDAFERMTTTDIINHFKKEITIYEEKYSSSSIVEESYACEGLEELLKELKESPEIGATLQGEIFNTVVRGGRKGKMYLRSAGTSVGKTRNMVADAANIAYPIRYSTLEHKWIVTNPSPEKTLYIMTEQDTEEIKTMLLSFLTGISEEVFLYGSFTDNEMPRIKTAIQIMETYKDNMLFARIPDPCASVIKNLFRKYNLQYSVENFFYDYIFSSPAMLNEYRDLALREDVALRLLSTTLKNLAVELNAFVETSTQISNEEKDDGSFKDYHNIRGSVAILSLYISLLFK